jgi:hypothetical protein
VVQTTDLARLMFHDGLAERDLAVAGHDDLTLVADGEHSGRGSAMPSSLTARGAPLQRKLLHGEAAAARRGPRVSLTLSVSPVRARACGQTRTRRSEIMAFT